MSHPLKTHGWRFLVLVALAGCVTGLFGNTSVAAQTITTTPNPVPPIRIDDQVILPGESFGDIVLAGSIADAEYAADQLTWEITGNTALAVQITDGVVSVTPLAADWIGAETLLFTACDSTGACSFDEAIFWVMEDVDAPVTVTFVGNAGFLLTVGDAKILIDALFEGFEDYALPAAELDLLLNAQPPFDDIDLILATHDHGDHFTAELVGQCLDSNPDAIFVSVETAAAQVSAAGHPAIALPSQPGAHTQLVVNDIGIEAMYLSHGDDRFPNLGYIITTGGRRFFHTGDIDPRIVTVSTLRNFGVPEKQIDIAFVTHFLLSGRTLPSFITAGIRPQYIVPIHYAYTEPPFNYERIAENFPDAILFRAEMDSWTMP